MKNYNLKDFFNGKSEGEGVVLIFGKVSEVFTVKMNGSLKGKQLELTEDFTYLDGRIQKRKWNFVFENEENFLGTASDIIGKATGSQKNNIITLKYKLFLEHKEITLNFVDRLWFVNENHILNKAGIYKYGIKVGEIIASFRKNVT